MPGVEEDKIYLGIIPGTEYPPMGSGYSPNQEYPEYLYEHVHGDTPLQAQNQVYHMVREGFCRLGYDKDNFGTAAWNPLGDLIKEGFTILIKPNWVMHGSRNKVFPDNMDVLVTHPSLVRAVIDYVLISLHGTGRIIVADAPMQGCDLEALFARTGYKELFAFYRKRGIAIEVKDLRECRVIVQNKVITKTISINGEDQSVQVDLGKASCHISGKNRRYKVSDYAASKTRLYHHDDTHIYNISRTALEADVVINMPKIKSHRLAGLTAGLKNMVGITYDKASLPHRTIGAKSSGGDEYEKHSIVKTLAAYTEEKKIGCIEKGRRTCAMFLQFFIGILYVMVKVCLRDKTMLGSWYGNDTIWRTVADLNIIARYADKNGVLHDVPQRRILNIADMVIAGQGNGPLAPSPKALGMILISENTVAMDVLCAKIMGYDPEKIPGLTASMTCKPLAYDERTRIVSNAQEFVHAELSRFVPEEAWRCRPHDSWKGHIEKL